MPAAAFDGLLDLGRLARDEYQRVARTRTPSPGVSSDVERQLILGRLLRAQASSIELTRLAARLGLVRGDVLDRLRDGLTPGSREPWVAAAALDLGERARSAFPTREVPRSRLGSRSQHRFEETIVSLARAAAAVPRAEAEALAKSFRDLLSDRRVWVPLRVLAARCMEELPRFATESVPVLEQALDEWSPRIRAAAARALGALSVDAKSSVPALGKALGDVDSRVRAAACVALGRIGGKASEHAKRMAELLGDSSRIARRDAAIGLGELGPRAPSECLDALIARLEDDAEGDSEVRRRVVEALGLMAAPRRDVVEALRKAREEKGLGPVAKTALERLGIDSNGESSAAPTDG